MFNGAKKLVVCALSLRSQNRSLFFLETAVQNVLVGVRVKLFFKV